MADGPYRIWLRRNGELPADWGGDSRIIDEDIWVGNVPNDGYSKISSGYTQHNKEWAYVEFATWEDLLKAIGEETTTVEAHVTGSFDQVYDGGGGGTITANVTGTFEQTT